MDIMGIVSTVNKVLSTVSKVNQTKDMIRDNINSKIKEPEKDNLGIYNGSLTSVISDYTIEPFIVTTRSAQNSEGVEGAYHLATNIFTSFYAQVFDILIKVHKLDANIVITLLSSKLRKSDIADIKDVLLDTGKDLVVQAGSKVFNKMMASKAQQSSGKSPFVSGESSIEYLFSDAPICLNQDMVTHEAVHINKVDPEHKNLGVKDFSIHTDGVLYGTLMREISVQIMVEDKVMTIPINVIGRLLSTTVESIISLLDTRGNSKSLSTRLDMARAGEISWIKDLVFCNDLAKEYKAGKLADSTNGGLDKITDRTKSSYIKKLLTGNKGFEGNYNFYIITHDDLILINKFMRGDIVTKERIKEDFLNKVNGMGVIILDDDYQKATVLIKDIYGSSILSYKVLENQSKTGKNSNDIMSELLRAMMANRQIGF